jgi:hypothetical protein
VAYALLPLASPGGICASEASEAREIKCTHGVRMLQGEVFLYYTCKAGVWHRVAGHLALELHGYIEMLKRHQARTAASAERG